MDQSQSYFFTYNKLLEERLSCAVHTIDSRIDKLYERKFNLKCDQDGKHIGCKASPYSNSSFLQFQPPYIRDTRNFSGPTNCDVRQLKELTGTEDIDSLIKNKSWSKESKQQLTNAVIDFYAQKRILELIRQKSALIGQIERVSANPDDVQQKIRLIDEQIEQVKGRKESRIFIPEDRNDPCVDWCAISAKLKGTQHDSQDCRLLWSNELHWTINDKVWTKDEDACLINAIQKHGKNDWDSVSRELNSNRLPWQCCARYQQVYSNVLSSTMQVNEEDTEKIFEVINICRIGDYVPWTQVMYFLQYYSLRQVKYQWNKLLSEKTSSQPWSIEEDELLSRTVQKFGPREWNRIASFLPGRSSKSCRERFKMRLSYRIRNIGKWNSREDRILRTMVDRFGTNWSLIAANFNERNSHQIRSRYELLKHDLHKPCPIKRRKLLRDSAGLLLENTRRKSVMSTDKEVEQQLLNIFTTFTSVKTAKKTLVSRGAQDEFIYQNLIYVLKSTLQGTNASETQLQYIISSAIKQRVTSRVELFPPSMATLKGFKAWTVHQSYLEQFSSPRIDIEAIKQTSSYQQILKIIISLFLWPAILSRFESPNVDTSEFSTGSIVGKHTKNLYKIREIQRQLTTNKL